MSASSWTRVLFEAIDDAVFVHDERGNILEANPAACRRLGYSREELLRLNTRDIDAPEFAAGFQNRLRSQFASGTMRCEGVHRTKDGRRIFVDINTSAIQLDGRPAVLAVMRDITQRKVAEEIHAKQSQLLQSILDHMSDAIVVADAGGEIVMFNPLAERIFGPGLLQGYFTLYAADGTTRVGEFPIARCVRGESFDELQMFVRHEEAPSGIWISVAGRPLHKADGVVKAGVLVCRDITATKRQERRLQAQYEIARVIASNQEFTVCLREILCLMASALDCDAALLWQVERGHDAIRLLEGWIHPLLSAENFRAQSQSCVLADDGDLIVRVGRDGVMQRADASDMPWATSPRWHAARQAGLQSVVALPIHSGDVTVGILELWSQRDFEEDDSLAALLYALANQIGQFLDRQRVESDLRDSRALYESLVESLPQNIFRKDRQGRVTFGNGRYCASLKRPLAELLGKTDFDLFPEEVAQKYVADDRRIMQTGETLDTVEEHYLPSGERLYVHVVKTPIFDAQNAIVGVQGIFWDVTQETLAQQAVTLSEKRYRQLTEATMDGIVVIDTTGSVVLFNPAAERMFGYAADEILGSPARLLAPAEFSELQAETISRYVAERLPELVGKPKEFQGRRKDGSDFPAEMVLSLLTDSAQTNGDGGRSSQILAAIRDLTERNKMRAFLLQNEKLASIGLLSAGVAHEINNPLAFVANNLVVLERDCKGMIDLLGLYDSARAKLDRDTAARIQEAIDAVDYEYIRDNLGRILSRTRDGIDRVTRIVHGLRGMARTEAPRRQTTSIPDLINSSLEILHGKFKRLGVQIEQNHDASPVVSCVPTQISQVVLNLLVNAFQAIEASHRTDGRIGIRTQRQKTEFLLEIEDNGIGIDAANLSRLFDPFFTTKDVGEGTGLGLSISHHIVTAHGGRIEVDAKTGCGTCFRVYLPLKEK